MIIVVVADTVVMIEQGTEVEVVVQVETETELEGVEVQDETITTTIGEVTIEHQIIVI